MSRKPDTSRPKGLSATDRTLWDYVTRNVDRAPSNRFTGFEVVATKMVPATIKVAPRKSTAGLGISPDELAKAMGRRPTPGTKRNSNMPTGTLSIRQNVAGLDKRSSERLRKGQMEIDGRIDLHGMRQGEAQSRLRTFISAGQLQGKRCVLVITGKGSSIKKTDDAAFMMTEKTGILRDAVPKWLAEGDMRRLVVDIRTAQPKHGGSGALYVLLRRSRS